MQDFLVKSIPEARSTTPVEGLLCKFEPKKRDLPWSRSELHRSQSSNHLGTIDVTIFTSSM